jgi:uncharacterized membrane protein YoaK (UPF0700 family)
MVLAATSGFVDAVGFLHLFGAFPANQSGNLVLLGMALTSPVSPPAWVSATSIVGFAVGTAGAAWAAARLPPRRGAASLLGVELALLIALAAGTALAGDDQQLLTGAGLGLLLIVAAVAMGTQTEVIRRAAGVAVTTTYETGAIARIGEAIGGRDGARRTTTLLVLGSLIAWYVGGAALGASRLGEGRTGLVAPCVAVAVVLAVVLAGFEPE